MTQLSAAPPVAVEPFAPPAGPSAAARWTGRIMSWLPAAFLLLGAVMNLVKPDEVVKNTVAVGFSESVIRPIGAVLLASTVLYLVPRTAVLGAVLLTGYLGGAVATHVRLGDPLFPQTLFPAFFGALLWGGLVLRDRRLRALLPLRTDPAGH